MKKKVTTSSKDHKVVSWNRTVESRHVAINLDWEGQAMDAIRQISLSAESIFSRLFSMLQCLSNNELIFLQFQSMVYFYSNVVCLSLIIRDFRIVVIDDVCELVSCCWCLRVLYLVW